MSTRRRRLGRPLVALYPQAWRRRYGDEMIALLHDDPPGVRGLASLLLGAADAHLRPQSSWSAKAAPLERIRLSISGLFCCWIAIAVVGAGFQKATEEPAFFEAARAHPLLAAAHAVVVAGAALGALAIAAGGLPLLWQALCQAHAHREPRLIGLLALPLVAIGAFATLTWLLLALAPANSAHPSTPLDLGLAAPWWVGGLACAISCAVAPRLVLNRVPVGVRSLRRAALAGLLLAAAMVLVTLALVAYDLALVLQAPALSAQNGGPIWASTGATLAAGAIVATLITALAVLSATRAARARALARAG
jgi:hypothetical protein